MAKFGQKSLDKLRTCDHRLIEIMNELVKIMDVTILEGHRDEATQNKAFTEGKSKLKYPNGKHNSIPSRAVDVVPFPVDFNDTKKIHLMAGLVLGIASQKGIKLRWGGDWDSDMDLKDNEFNDLVHFELKD